MPIIIQKELFFVPQSKRGTMSMLQGYAQGVVRGMIGMLESKANDTHVKVYMTLSLIRDLTTNINKSIY